MVTVKLYIDGSLFSTVSTNIGPRALNDFAVEIARSSRQQLLCGTGRCGEDV